MSNQPVRYVKGSGRMTPVLIVPTENVYSSYSACNLCTWVAVPSEPGEPLKMRLKYVSASCHAHAKVPRISAW